MKFASLILALVCQSLTTTATVLVTGIPAGSVISGVALETVIVGLAAAAGSTLAAISLSRRGRRDVEGETFEFAKTVFPVLLLFGLSACGGLRTGTSMPVLTAYFPVLA